MSAPDDRYIETPVGAIDITQIVSWVVILTVGGVITAVVLHHMGR